MSDRPQWPENGEVEFQDVSLRYRPNSDLVLQNVSFHVQPCEKIGIVGRTGAGKSTIAVALSRIVEVAKGRILLDGVDIAQVPIKELRKRITVIPQEPTLFTGTLRSNLDPDENFRDHQIVRVLKKACMMKLLKHDAMGLYQQISEGGENFSSGERQLICVCRAILQRTRLIVLDEATAQMDLDTEKRIQALIQDEFCESTMIMIAHRLNTIMSCDRVLVLSFGNRVEFDAP